MTKILFICHGNICRSPMAEFIMKQLVEQAGRAADFEIASAAVSTEEIGNDIYPPAKRMLASKGVPFERRAARKMTLSDYAYYDHIVCMDQSNLRWLRYIIPSDPDNKVSLMMAWAGKSRDVADPWYTGDFTKAYDDILEGCQGMLLSILAHYVQKKCTFYAIFDKNICIIQKIAVPLQQICFYNALKLVQN